ncbi:Hypothetical predicted protein, partial [Paramuricea clavata]
NLSIAWSGDFDSLKEIHRQRIKSKRKLEHPGRKKREKEGKRVLNIEGVGA